MRNALIVGAGGQDGRLLAQLLIDRGYSVRGWVRSEGGGERRGFECLVVDLLRPELVEAELRRFVPDEIYYLAAFHHSSEDAIEESPAELLRCNFNIHVLGLLNVLQGMEECCPNARLFYASSSHVFGASKRDSHNEETPFAPISAYGISKAAGVRSCQFYRRQKNVFVATGILFNHESRYRKRTFLSQKIVQGALRALREPSYQIVLGNLDARVDWGYGPDYVDAMFRILQLPEADDFVIASGETHTVRDFAEEAFGALGLDWRRHVKTDPSLVSRAFHGLRGDFAKLRHKTGWTPSMGFKEMVARLVTESEKNCEIA